MALAHVLCRPIIIIAETMLRDSEGVAIAPIPFGGVYLPLEVSPEKCHRTPLLLAYHSAHFSPLVTVDCGNDFGDIPNEGVSIPLVDPDSGKLLPVLFAIDPGPDWEWTEKSRDLLPCHQETMEILIREYLDCEYQTLSLEDLDRLSDGDGTSSNRNKAAKQLLGVAKQFGSIGKSVSKRLWPMAKRPKSPPLSLLGGITHGVLCVRLKSRRHQYVDQMLQNYLQCAHSRYILNIIFIYFLIIIVLFIYLFRYLETHQGESNVNYGAGKSKFYATSDSESYASVSKLQPMNPNKDKTLYLSRFI